MISKLQDGKRVRSIKIYGERTDAISVAAFLVVAHLLNVDESTSSADDWKLADLQYDRLKKYGPLYASGIENAILEGLACWYHPLDESDELVKERNDFRYKQGEEPQKGKGVYLVFTDLGQAFAYKAYLVKKPHEVWV